MKKIILFILSLFSLSANSQPKYVVQELSIDPTSYKFCMYYNNILSVTSVRLDENINNSEFSNWYKGYTLCKLSDSIMFVLEKDFYRIYIPDINTIFTVQPLYKTQSISLGDHLIQFISIIREYRKSKLLTLK